MVECSLSYVILVKLIVEVNPMSENLTNNPKYNGMHPCPECGTVSHWTCVSEAPIKIRIECNGRCCTYELRFSEVESRPFFHKQVASPALK